MQIARQQLLNGFARYIRNETIPHIPDRSVRVLLETLAVATEVQSQIVGRFLDIPWVAAILQEKDGLYDLDLVEMALTKSMESHGGLEVTIPAIPLIMPQQKTMTFTANDIRAMKRYMEGV